MGYGSVGNDIPINKAYPLFADDLEQRAFDPEKAARTTRSPAIPARFCCAPPTSLSPAPSIAAQLYQQSCAAAGITVEVKREPGDGYWSEVWNKQPSRPPIVVAVRPRTRCIPPPTIQRPTGTTRASSTRSSTSCCDGPRRARHCQAQGHVSRHGDHPAGRSGLIAPMFNDYIDATGPGVEGWVEDPNYELSGGYALQRCWLAVVIRADRTCPARS